MRKIISILLSAAMLCTMAVALSSCSDKSDWEKINEKGSFTCGITIYEPMNYEDENGELTGFDTELARAVAEKLGVKVNFTVITWGSKYLELQSGAIDCIWNGFTSNTNDDDGVARSEKVDFTYAYLDNAQCVIVRSADANSYTTMESLSGKKAAVESGSAGESFAVNAGAVIVGKTSQSDTFIELKSGAVDFIVVDVLLADKRVGTGDFTDFVKADIDIEKEEYSIGCRKGSDFDEKINEALLELLNEGVLEQLAEKYSVHITASLLAMKTAE